MAAVTVDRAHRIGFLLESLEYHWNRLPSIVVDIKNWNQDDQEEFILDTLHTYESLLRQLEGHVQQSELSPEQMARYAGLIRLISHNKPYLQRILNWYYAR